MDKPVTLSVKDYLIRKLAVKMRIPENTLEAVVNHQCQSINKATHVHKSIEISGFGKILFNEGRAQRLCKYLEELLPKLQEELLTSSPARQLILQNRIERLIKDIAEIKPRIHGLKPIKGRVEEQPLSKGTHEGIHSSDKNGETEDL